MRFRSAAAAVVVLITGCGDLVSTAPVEEAHYEWYASDGSRTCAIRGGEAWCRAWDGTEVLEGIDVREFTFGWSHACALVTDGTAWCWGDRGLTGRVGDPAAPGPADTDARFTAIRAYEERTCALANPDGVIWCWGFDFSSAGLFGWPAPGVPELCGSYRECPLPTPMPTAARFTDFGLGQTHACGLTAGGEIWCWGLNANGQLGRGSVSEPAQCAESSCGAPPAPVAASARFRALAVTGLGACGLARDGTAWCWGLGDGTPAPIDGYRFSELVGGTIACGRGADRIAHCWHAAGADSDLEDASEGRPRRVPGYYFDRLFPSFGLSCGANRVTGVVCWDGPGSRPEVVPGQL